MATVVANQSWKLIFSIKPSVTARWRMLNSIELSTSWQFINHILIPIYKSFDIQNQLLVETIKTFQFLNELESKVSLVKSWKIRNWIGATPQYNTATYQILIDDTDVTDFILDTNINLSEDNYVNTVDIKFSDLTLYANFKPITKDATERIRIFINGIEYAFLLEERTSNVEFNELNFSIWGRSKLAVLDKPFSEVSVLEFADSGLASDIIDRFASGLLVTFDIVNFFINKNTLQINEKTPLEIIKTVVKAGGGIIRSGKKNELIVRYKYPNLKNINLLTPDLTLNDLTDITILDESEKMSNGLNAVLVEGKIGRISRLHGLFEVDPVRNPNGRVGAVGTPFHLRLYLFPISSSSLEYPNDVYKMELSNGEYLYQGSLTETITDEVIRIINGQATTRYPIQSMVSTTWLTTNIGSLSITNVGDNYLDLISTGSKRLGIAKITYVTEYDLYYIFNTSVSIALVASIREVSKL